MIKSLETWYNGIWYRSRLEARWAAFFDACGVRFEYEPQGYSLGNGICYLPDFLLHRVAGRVQGDLYVEVKGEMTAEASNKVALFSEEYPILVLTSIPMGSNITQIHKDVQNKAYNSEWISTPPFNFLTIDGDCFAAHPGINKRGRFEIFGDATRYTAYRDDERTVAAYSVARNMRFEHGQHTVVGHVIKEGDDLD